MEDFAGMEDLASVLSRNGGLLAVRNGRFANAEFSACLLLHGSLRTVILFPFDSNCYGICFRHGKYGICYRAAGSGMVNDGMVNADPATCT